MGWEQRGNNRYYYKKEREGSRVKSVYVGRGEIAQMVSQIQSSSPVLDRLAGQNASSKLTRSEMAEATLDQTADLIHLLTQAVLLACGFHTHKRQWRKTRKRNDG
jgi:hypothetical protein